MTESILDSIKKLLGMDSTYTAFDVDVIMHINSVFNDLNSLGIGPTNGFMISDNTTTWDVYLGSDLNLNSVKSYMYLKVKLLFDPPATSFAIDSMEKMILKAEWLLNVKREGESWTDPNPTPTPPTVPCWWETF